jgi:hypothetical protein
LTIRVQKEYNLCAQVKRNGSKTTSESDGRL